MRGETFPDPNSPVLSELKFPVPLKDLFDFLSIRDLIFEARSQDIEKAIRLAQSCRHPDAVWLADIFGETHISTCEKASEIFLQHAKNGLGLLFAWSLGDLESNLAVLQKSADLGCAVALAFLSVRTENKNEAFRLAQAAVAQREREGFLSLGICFENGYGCSLDLERAKQNYLIAAELNSSEGARCYIKLLADSDPVRWTWLGREAVRGQPMEFLDIFVREVEAFFCGAADKARAVFTIGRALKGNIEGDTLFCFTDPNVSVAIEAVEFYDFQVESARRAVAAWTFVGIRFKVVKDVRKLIGKLIWDARVEANYEYELELESSGSPNEKRIRN